ncbi:acid phosphatase pho5 [Yamadazyma tenuis]|uniref:acid phosphatase pho5 n=1 Tax=Candida tenuis TaxID=2315449 RepID=UPI0027A232AE|nr:acid phosphatase pho5 [Yamadazyma tenuis]
MKLTSLIAGLILPHHPNVATPELAASEQYNLLNFLGGSGPYFQYSGYGISPLAPPQCQVDQAYLIGRHGERFPTGNSGIEYNSTIHHLKGQSLNGTLEFLTQYEFFVTDSNNFDQEVTLNNSDSIYSGSLSAHRDGESFRRIYGHLYDPSTIFPVFSTNSRRCYDTSVNFIKGFMGDEYNTRKVKFNIMGEDSSTGANSLTPRQGCLGFQQAKIAKYKQYTRHFAQIRTRLQVENPTLNISDTQIGNLFDACAYEINVKGHSQLCGIFTNNELVSNEYNKDVSLYHEVGAGNRFSQAAGSPLVRSLLQLLHDKSNPQKLWISFTHDYDLVTLYTALSLFTDHLDAKEIQFDRQFTKSHIIPQSTRLIVERLACGGNTYVRIILNDSVLPMRCKYGPGFSCSLQEVSAMLEPVVSMEYNDQCDNRDLQRAELTFYWDYDEVEYNAPLFP